MAKESSCDMGHTKETFRGKDDDELVRNVQSHISQKHAGIPMPTREQILSQAREV